MGAEKATWRETFHVMRPVCVFLAAMGVVALAMAVKGWHAVSLMLAIVLLLIGALLAIQVHRAVLALRRRSAMLREASAQAEEHYVDVLRRIIRFVEAREPYTDGRSRRIGRLAEQLARRMELPEPTCRMMKLAGELHDIGLIAVPESILNRPLRWGVSEFREVKKHASISHEVLRPLRMLDPVLGAIRHHHERMNGTGYPSGASGRKIPLEARILAVADAYDAMTHDRPHRAAMSPLAAMRELQRCTPSGYDPDCVRALADVIHLPLLEEARPALGQPDPGHAQAAAEPAGAETVAG